MSSIAASMFEERLANLTKMAMSTEILPAEIRDNVLRILALIGKAYELDPQALTRGGVHSSQFGEELGELPELLSDPAGPMATAWCRRVSRLLGDLIVTQGLRRHDGVRDPRANDILAALQAEDQRLAIHEDAERFRASTQRMQQEAAELVEEARGAATVAKSAAGITGSASLATYFEQYATKEAAASNWFRCATILAILVAVAVAYFLPHPTAGDWVGAAYRIAILLGVAGLSAYLGRQAGQHRRVYNWAKAIQVQLLSFPAFMETIQASQSSDAIYEAFAKRVLGAPPEGAQRSKAGDSEVSSGQLVELLTAFAKRDG